MQICADNTSHREPNRTEVSIESIENPDIIAYGAEERLYISRYQTLLNMLNRLRYRNSFQIIVLSLFILLVTIQCGRSGSKGGPGDQPKKLRVWGYLFAPGSWDEAMSRTSPAQLTDISLAFIQPDANGQLADNPSAAAAASLARNNKLQVYFSIGGGNPPPHLEALMQPAQRGAFVRNLVAFTQKHGFDGIDVDIENSLINEHYEGFVNELSIALKAAGKKMTAALASWNAGKISDHTLALFDCILVMSYDKTGPWNPANAGPHSPLSMLQDDFSYFSQTRKIPADKLLMGLPFYGYGFGPGAPESLTYKDIVQRYAGAAQKDEITLPEGGHIYYNGVPTIRSKVEYVLKNKGGGVMIWQLLGDAAGDSSLLYNIRKRIAP